MKKTLIAASLILSLCAEEKISFLDENQRFSIEPDFAYSLPHKNKDEGYEVINSGYFYGINFCYDYLKPNNIYAGFDLCLSVGKEFYDVYVDKLKYAEFQERHYKNQMEGRIGYTLTLNHLSFTPFSGAGDFLFSGGDVRFNFAYVPIGLLAEYKWENISFGVNAEQLHYVYFFTHSKYYGSENSYVFNKSITGYEISLPLSFTTDVSQGQWFGKIEPYYLRLFSTAAYVGARVSAIYNF